MRRFRDIAAPVYARIMDFLAGKFIYPTFYNGKSRGFLRALSCQLLDFQWRSVKLHITHQCNLACRNCYAGSSVGEMSRDEIFFLLDQLRPGLRSRMLRLDLLGGEPLLRPDFAEIVSYARKKARIGNIQVFTNGILITPETAKKIKTAGLDAALVTIHSHRKEVHEGITGVAGSWEKTVSGIAASVSAGIATYAMTIPVSANADHLPEIEAFTKRLGAKTAYFPYIRRREKDDLLIENDALFFAAINRIFSRSSIHRQRLLDNLSKRKKVCSAYVNTVSIRPDGTLTPCAFLDLPLGNVREEKFYSILHRAWKNRELTEFLSVPEECRSCGIVDFCGGGCKAYRFTRDRDTKNKDITCRGPFCGPLGGDDLGKMPYLY